MLGGILNIRQKAIDSIELVRSDVQERPLELSDGLRYSSGLPISKRTVKFAIEVDPIAVGVDVNIVAAGA
jgi:hypothetical protein